MVHSEEGETGVRLGVDWDGCATDVYCCDCDCCAVTVWWWQVESVGWYQEVRVVVVVVPDSLCCPLLRPSPSASPTSTSQSDDDGNLQQGSPALLGSLPRSALLNPISISELTTSLQSVPPT